MSEDSFYNSREIFIPKSDQGGINREKSVSTSTRRDRVRRSKNKGLRRFFHLLRKKSVRKFLICMILTIILSILFTMFQNF